MDMDMDVYVYIGSLSCNNLPKGHMLPTRLVISWIHVFVFIPSCVKFGGFHMYGGVPIHWVIPKSSIYVLNCPWNKLFMFSILGPFMEPHKQKMFLWFPIIFLWFSYDVPMIFQCFKPHVFPAAPHRPLPPPPLRRQPAPRWPSSRLLGPEGWWIYRGN